MANNRPNISTETYLMNILNEMKANIERGKTIEENRAEAQLLEDFFNEIGKYNENPDNIIEGSARAEMREAIQALHMGKVWSFLGVNGLKEMSGTGFEDYLGRLTNRIMQNAKKYNLATWSKSYNYIINLGSQTVDIYKNISDDISNEVTKKLIDETYKDIRPKLEKDADEAHKKLGINARVQGKIDNAMRYIDFEVTTENPILQKVLPLLAQATFSDKAYLTTGDVVLGQTNSFRVFLAVSGEGSAEEKVYHWYRMLTCMDHHGYHNASSLFYQIRYMYELTGYGLKYTENKINEALGSLGAKYFIYYHEGKIKVISTAVIINDLINAVRDDHYFEIHSAKYKSQKNYALYAKLKMRMQNGVFEFG
jgi:hypothetical protein